MNNKVANVKVFKSPEAARYIARSVAWLKLARRGLTDIAGPKFIRIGKRIYYPVEELDRWLEQFELMTVLPKELG